VGIADAVQLMRTAAVEERSALLAERGELPSRLLEDAAGSDVLQLRRDAVKAAKVLELVSLVSVDPQASPPLVDRRTMKTVAVAAVVGIVVGLLLALLLAHTAFAPSVYCHDYPNGSYTCTGPGG
jgi:ElaB/YqjD/DUF883 family membrane-anchored ribosome-binding protein